MINARVCIEAVVLMTALFAVYLTFFNKPPLDPNGPAIRIFAGELQGKAYRGEFANFIYTFEKLRDDCHSPEISRTIVDVKTGNFKSTRDDVVGVIQFPKSLPFQKDKIAVRTLIPSTVELGEKTILSESCYICPRADEPICRAYSTDRFIVRDR